MKVLPSWKMIYKPTFPEQRAIQRFIMVDIMEVGRVQVETLRSLKTGYFLINFAG